MAAFAAFASALKAVAFWYWSLMLLVRKWGEPWKVIPGDRRREVLLSYLSLSWEREKMPLQTLVQRCPSTFNAEESEIGNMEGRRQSGWWCLVWWVCLCAFLYTSIFIYLDRQSGVSRDSCSWLTQYICYILSKAQLDGWLLHWLGQGRRSWFMEWEIRTTGALVELAWSGDVFGQLSPSLYLGLVVDL